MNDIKLEDYPPEFGGHITIRTESDKVNMSRVISAEIIGYQVKLQLIRKGKYMQGQSPPHHHQWLTREMAIENALESYKDDHDPLLHVVRPYNFSTHYVIALIVEINEMDGTRLATSAEEVKARAYPLITPKDVHLTLLGALHGNTLPVVHDDKIEERLNANLSFLRFLNKPVQLFKRDIQEALGLCSLSGREINRGLDSYYAIARNVTDGNWKYLWDRVPHFASPANRSMDLNRKPLYSRLPSESRPSLHPKHRKRQNSRKVHVPDEDEIKRATDWPDVKPPSKKQKSYEFGGCRRRPKSDSYIEATFDYIAEQSEIRRRHQDLVRHPFQFQVYGVNTKQCDIKESNYVQTGAVITILNNRIPANTNYRACIININVPDPITQVQVRTSRHWRTDSKQMALDDDDRDQNVDVILNKALDHIYEQIGPECDDTVYLRKLGL